MKLSDRRTLVALAFCALVVLWGLSFPAAKIGLEYAPPLLFAGLRCLLGGLPLMLAALMWGGKPGLVREWPSFALLTLFNAALFIALQTYTIDNAPSGTAAVLIYLQPILVGLLAWLALGESLSGAKIAGLLLGFSGIVAVSASSFTGSGGGLAPVGVAFGSTAALAWAIGTVCFKRAQERVSTLWAVGLPFVAGGALLLALGSVFEGWGEIRWTSEWVASLSYSSLAGIGLAWALWLALVRTGEASRVAAYIFAVPITAVVIGVLFLGETLSAALFLGAALVVSGIYLVNRAPAWRKL